MKKNLISLASILSAILLFSITAGAQITNNYNLSGYKLPDYRLNAGNWKLLDTRHQKLKDSVQIFR